MGARVGARDLDEEGTHGRSSGADSVLFFDLSGGYFTIILGFYVVFSKMCIITILNSWKKHKL